MAGGRLQGQVAVDPVAVLPEVELPGLVHRGDAVGEELRLALPTAELGLGARLRAAVLLGRVGGVEVGGRQQVAGVGEGGHPTPVPELGVPAHVVGVQVGVDHQVDVGRAHAHRRQAVQEVGVPVGEVRGVRPVRPFPTPVSTRIVRPSLRSTQVCTASTSAPLAGSQKSGASHAWLSRQTSGGKSGSIVAAGTSGAWCSMTRPTSTSPSVMCVCSMASSAPVVRCPDGLSC